MVRWVMRGSEARPDSRLWRGETQESIGHGAAAKAARRARGLAGGEKLRSSGSHRNGVTPVREIQDVGEVADGSCARACEVRALHARQRVGLKDGNGVRAPVGSQATAPQARASAKPGGRSRASHLRYGGGELQGSKRRREAHAIPARNKALKGEPHGRQRHETRPRSSDVPGNR